MDFTGSRLRAMAVVRVLLFGQERFGGPFFWEKTDIMEHGADRGTWLTARQIACARLPGLPHTARGVRRLARREGWRCQRDGQTGGDGRPLTKGRTGQRRLEGFDEKVISSYDECPA